MSEEQAKGYGRIGWGIGASVLLHVLVGAAFLVRLPMPVTEPPQEETVQVELVPPPEEPKPDEKAPEEKKPEAPKPLNLTMADEPKPEEPKPEPPKPEEPKKEEAPPPPPPPPLPAPEEPKPEEPKKEEPPPPKPEEAKPEEAKPEEPKPEEAKPPEQPAEEPEEAGKGKPQPLDVLRPVVEFGDKDSGPRKAPDGNSSADEGTPDAEPSDAPPVDAPPEPAAPDAPEAPEATKPEQAKGSPVPEIAVPEVSALAASGQGPGAPALPPLPDAVTAGLVAPNPLPPDVPEKPDTPPKAAPKPGTKPALPQAKRLFSTSETGEAVARTAMGSIPRGIRASQLCSTELREQLRHGSPSYSPELLPAYRLASGTVMEVRKGAFRAEAQWYDLSFRCEVDEKVTKVTSFAFEVGSPVPQSQWRKRGFPDF